MRSTEELRDQLTELAGPVTPADGYEALVLRRAARIRARRRLAGAGAAVMCVALLASLFWVAGVGPAPRPAATPPDGPFLGWPAAGTVDTALVAEATRAWGGAGPHTAVRPLVATRDRLLQSVVVLEGYDRRDQARLAFFTGDRTAAGALRLRADRPAPDPASTRVVSLVSARLTGPAGVAGDTFWDTYAIAVAMPGVTSVRMSSTSIDQELRGDPETPTGRFVVAGLPTATPETTTIEGYVRSSRLFARWTRVFAVPGDGGAEGDTRAVRGDVVRRDGDRVVVALEDGGPVRPGQLAVVAAGLAGRVAAVDAARGEATVELVTSPGFASTAYTAISNVPGSVRGTGGKLVMDHIPAGDKMEIYQGNRVMVPDPAHGTAVTIGRAAATKAATAGTVELTPTADLANLRRVSIVTPP
ncbi:RNA polymerase subunit sigma-70 [Actinoplanes sp. CA-030573]|uniref:RNA polymerase subunit sigma-70 n=1 Tax=Actinoplanes sp. CA-030573 TaxID=3239898 RepID=UPI003D94D9D0